MDALSVVLQLKRIAADYNPSADTVSKIPRLAVGLSYFLEHPDMSVKHEAAKALLVTCDFHLSTILNSVEVKELRKNAIQHSFSKDEFLHCVCGKIVDILSKNNCKSTQTYKKEEASIRKMSNVDDEKNVEKHCMEKEAYTEEKIETKANIEMQQINLVEPTEVSFSKSNDTSVLKEGHQHLCNKENKINDSRKNLCAPSSSGNYSPSHYNPPSQPCSFLKSEEENFEGKVGEENELYTLILRLKELKEEDKVDFLSKENVIKDLQKSIICMPGVISATVNVKNEEDYDHCYNTSNGKVDAEKSFEDNEKILFIEKEKTRVEQEDEKKMSKMKIFAIVVIKLPFDESKRKEILQYITKSYCILKAQNMSNKGGNGSLLSNELEKNVQNFDVEIKVDANLHNREKKHKSEEKTNHIQKSVINDMHNHENYIPEEECNRNETIQVKQKIEIEESYETGGNEDEFNSDTLDLEIKSNSETPAYLDELENEENVKKIKCDIQKGSNCNHKETWTQPTSAWNFFTHNSALFGNSKYLSNSAIVPSDDDPNLIIKLRKEKERRATERMQQLRTQNTLDKVLQGISNIKFW